MRYRGFVTLFKKELLRFYKVMLQTIAAPIVTTLLYLTVFAQALDRHVTVYGQFSYTVFLVPGLVMMTVLQNAFANSSSSLIQSKVSGNIVFLLLTPVSYLEFYLAFTLAAMARAMIVGTGVYLTATLFIAVPIYNLALVLAFALLGGGILATMGIVAGVWADKFDQLAGFQNFVILPLTFLSGVFYSIHSLPEIWQWLSRMNPFFYMIDGFRYGFFGVSDVDPLTSLAITAAVMSGLSALTVYLLRTGYKLRD